MKNSLWIILILLIILLIRKKQQTAVSVQKMLRRKKQDKESSLMKELAKQFIGKECIIYTVASFDGGLQGTIREVQDSGMVIERKSGEREIINLDFVTRIREYPRKKNGKKKSIVLD